MQFNNIKRHINLILSLFLFSCSSSITAPETLEGEPMPSFNITLMDSAKDFNTNDIVTGWPIVLFYFSVNCPYCRQQTQEIVDNIKSLTNIQFFFLSDEPLSGLRSHSENFQLKKLKNIVVAQDNRNFISTYFNIQIVPFIAIYDKNKKLKRIYRGGVKTDMIKDIVLN